VLADISREHCKQKAVKADNADVPKYLWKEHLLDGLIKKEWAAAQLIKVRRISNWLRSQMLHWWKQNVTVLYIQWSRDKYKLPDV
jgi:hypothetical protein